MDPARFAAPTDGAAAAQPPLTLPALLEALLPVARAAGQAVMQIYATDFAVQGKADASPVTAADEQAEAIILQGLARLAPGVPVVAEESVAAGRVPDLGGSGGTGGAVPPERFWLVDPLDGTREFIQRNGQFTVNIALIEHGVPRLGVVFAPALGRLFAGIVGEGAFEEDAQGRRTITTRAVPALGLSVLASRSHGDEAALQAWVAAQRAAGQAVHEVGTAGSSLKLCLLAAGQADAYPRFGRTMEWDIAAGHAVLAAAGGGVWALDASNLRYGKPGFESPHFVAWGRAPGG